MNDEDKEQINLGSGIGSLLQLAAKGPNDDFIHKNETAHLFEGKYFQHTPFIVNNESFTLNVDFGKVYSASIPIKGDFLKDIFL